MIEHSIDLELLAYLYSSQLVTKDNVSLCDEDRFYYKWLTEIIQFALDSGEFSNTSTAQELMHIYAMYERALLYDWARNFFPFKIQRQTASMRFRQFHQRSIAS